MQIDLPRYFSKRADLQWNSGAGGLVSSLSFSLIQILLSQLGLLIRAFE
jgi:hypothetical protein